MTGESDREAAPDEPGRRPDLAVQRGGEVTEAHPAGVMFVSSERCTVRSDRWSA
jgi:hypothetical protein